MVAWGWVFAAGTAEGICGRAMQSGRKPAIGWGDAAGADIQRKQEFPHKAKMLAKSLSFGVELKGYIRGCVYVGFRRR